MTEAAVLTQRLAKLEKQLSSFKEITGVDPSSGPFIVTTLSINRDTITGGYFISFLSQPGEIFQIQSSVDAVVWEVADNSVNAAASPAISSTWLSVPYAPEAIIYFRVRRYPRTLPLPDLNTPVNMSPPLADTPTLQQLLAMVASIQDQIDAIDYTADASTRLRDIHTPTQLAAALLEPGELILRLKNPITLPSGNTSIPPEKTIEFGLHWFIDGGGSTVSFFGKCVAERRTIFVGFVAGDIVGTFGGTDVFPEWWGLTNNLHDVAINCAVRASSLSTNGFGIKVSLANRIYDVSAPIDLSGKAVTLEGAGSNLTYLRSTTSWVPTWIKAEVWGAGGDPANHAAMIWIGSDLGQGSNSSYRTKVKGMEIQCYNAAFAHKTGGLLRVSGISSKGFVEECSVITDVVVGGASGFGIGFCRHRVPGSNWADPLVDRGAAIINGLDISSSWIVGATFTDFYGMYFSGWTNNCTVRNVTVDVGLAKSASTQYGVVVAGAPLPEGATIYPLPAWIQDYPHTAIYAAGYITLTDIHIEGSVIGIFIPEIGGASNVTATNIKAFAMMDRARGAVYELDGKSGAEPPANTDYYGYGSAILIAGASETAATPTLNWKGSATLTSVSTNGACCYLVRDAAYGVNRSMYGMGQFPLGGLGGRFSFYTRGNIYSRSTVSPYNYIDGGTYDPANPTSAQSTSRTFFIGPIF